MSCDWEEKMDKNYNIDGWSITLPQDWKMSLDEEVQPPQLIFYTDGPVNVYISTWGFTRPETGETADTKTIFSFFARGFAGEGIQKSESFSEYYPEGFETCEGKGLTSDGCVIHSFAVCAQGHALSYYVVGDEGADFEEYIKYVKTVSQS